MEDNFLLYFLFTPDAEATKAGTFFKEKHKQAINLCI